MPTPPPTPPPPSPPASPDAEAWTSRRLLAWMGEAFAKAGLESPRLQAEMLLAHVIGCQRLRLFIEADRVATDAERARLRELAARALRHEPIDYLVGERSFFGLMFTVDRRVLVPRPSTETIVEFVLQEARRAGHGGPSTAGNAGRPGGEPARSPDDSRASRPARGEVVFDLHDRGEVAALSAFKPTQDDLEEDEDESSLDRPRPEPRLRETFASGALASDRGIAGVDKRGTPVAKRARAGGPAWSIADVCTGSGCIAVSLAHHLPASRVIATDISKDALAVAAENVRRHQVGNRVELVQGNLLEALAGRVAFDAIVSNPPYIPDDEWGDVPPNVKDHEPTLALRGGTDGLDLVRPLIEGAPALLKPGGWLLVEVAASRANEALALARGVASLVEARVLRDSDNLPRVVAARRRE